MESAGVLIKEKYEMNREKYEDDVMDIYQTTLEILEASLLPQNHAKDYNAILALEGEHGSAEILRLSADI